MALQVLFISEDKNGNIILTREQIEDLLEQAYQKGYSEGKAAAPVINPVPDYWNPPNRYDTTPVKRWWEDVYCTTNDTSRNDKSSVTTASWNDKNTIPSTSVHVSYTGDDDWMTIGASKAVDDTEYNKEPVITETRGSI